MRRLFLFALCLLAVGLAKAKLQVSTESDGTVVLTLQSSGDLANEFTYKDYAKYQASDLLQPYLNATKIKVVTANGVKMSNDDVDRLCGMAEEENNFPKVNKLDMEFAAVQNDSKLTNLGFMDNLKTIIYPRTTTVIPNMNYKNCKIENVIIPNNVSRSVTISTQVFGNSIKTLVLGDVDPNGTSKIEQQAFLNSNNLTSVDFGFGWKTIGRQAFMDCTALKEITLPEGLEKIEYGAFSGAAIEAIRLPNTLKKIEGTAFRCHHLKSITIPASVEHIEGQAFQENYELTDVYVLGKNTKADNQAFDEAAVTQFTYSNPSGISPVTRAQYTRGVGGKPIAMLHYPEEAKDKYVNPSSNGVGGYTQNVMSVTGDTWPTLENGKYSVCTGDYAGWNNFVLTTKTNSEEIWTDDKRVEDKWYTMCLPFAMTRVQLESAYGAKVEVVEFSGVEVTKNTATNDKFIKLKFKKQVESTVAHCPYMIHPALHAGTTTGVVNTIVGIKKEAEEQSKLDAMQKTFTEDGVTYTFIGNYTAGKNLPQYTYYYYSGKDESIYKNGFYKWVNATGGTWTRYTACVLLDKDNGANAKAVTIFYEDPDNTVTGIESPTVVPATPSNLSVGKVMNLNGQVVRMSSTSLVGLPKGIYIVNGKKIAVH